MNKKLTTDHADRVRMIEDIHTNFLVEAGAGSGKTTSLVGRMLTLIASGKAKIHEICAITFTRKAAAELEQRFQEALDQAARRESDSNKKERVTSALKEIETGYIGTIHSFCAALLRERPVEAGLTPEFSELDAMQDALLQKKAWLAHLQEEKQNSAAVLQALDSVGIEPSDLEATYQRLCQYTDVEISYAPHPRPELIPTLRKLETLLEKHQAHMPIREPEKGWDDLSKAMRFASRRFRYFAKDDTKAMVEVLVAFQGSLKVVQKNWADKSLAKQAGTEFTALQEEDIQPLLTAWRVHCHSLCMELLMPAVERYKQNKKEQSLLNFQDLLSFTAKMLKDYPEVRLYFASRYRYLLVDEFQDTDPLQAQIMMYLTGEDRLEQDITKLIPRPGALFVVGDPKQSIYRFRRADIDTYSLVKKLIVQGGGEVLRLTANFRSVRPLGEWFNETYQRLLPLEPTTYQAEFSKMDTVQEAADDTLHGVKTLVVPESLSKKEDVVRFDAEAIAKCILGMVQKKLRLSRSEKEVKSNISEEVQFRDCMILLHYKDGIEEYAKALERHGIPYVTTGGTGMGEALEVYELCALLRALSDPLDSIALLGVLRGLLFGCSDRELYLFKHSGGQFTMDATIPEALEETLQTKLQRAFERLQTYKAWTIELPASVWLERILTDTGAFAYALYGESHKSRVAALVNIIETVRTLETAKILSVEEVLLLIEQMAKGDEEEINLLGEGQNAVRIMNLHKAKGLEAPIVFLAHPAKMVNRDCDLFVKRTGNVAQGFVKIVKPKGEHQEQVIAEPLHWDTYSKEESEYSHAEQIRLLYVAGTRAKHQLIISTSKDQKKNPWKDLLTEDLEAVEIPDIRPIEKTSGGGGRWSVKDIETLQKASTEWIRDKAQKTYANKRATEFDIALPKDDIENDLRAQSSREEAAIKGTILHKGLELLVKGSPYWKKSISLLLKEANMATLEEEIIAMAEEFQVSPEYQRIKHAKQVLTEVPFYIRVDEQSKLKIKVMKEGVPVYLSGVIDLLYLEEDGWVILDYKSAHIETEDEQLVLQKQYQNQLEIYRLAWEEMTGEKVKEAKLYFASVKPKKL